jgi:hypothetical protein
VFQRLGVKVEQVLVDQSRALHMLRSGELDALVRVVGKPVEFFTRIPPDSGLHLVPIPFTKTFADYYTLGEFTAKDYPNLIPEGQRVDTIAVPSVLAVFNWPKGSDRYRRVERFVEQLFLKWDRFQQPPRHPKWRDVNLAATVPGWTRFVVAEQMLQRRGVVPRDQEQLSRDFQAFLNQSGKNTAALDQADREALFRQFLQWREQQQRPRQ